MILLVGHVDVGATMTGPLGYISGLASDYGDAVAVALIGRNEYSTATTEKDALRYASQYGLSAVLYDGSYDLVNTWSDSNPPKAYVIDAELNIVWTAYGGGITESAIRSQLDSL